MEIIDPVSLLRVRIGQSSFHVASEAGMRIEFMRFMKGQELGPFRYDGQVLAYVINGTFSTGATEDRVSSGVQVLFSGSESIHLKCESPEGAIELVWAPPFEKVNRQ